jgi:Tol biopolymer transport system component
MKGYSRTGLLPVLFHFCRAALLVAAAGGAQRAGGQYVVRSWLPWRTVETRHFAFHYPTELEAWTRAVAARADAIDSAVARVVGFAPSRKTQVVVDDPFNLANGSAWTYLDTPTINLWAMPPDPRDDISEFRNWGEMLLSHEFGHIAHLTRPSRNSTTRRFWELFPVDFGPIALRAPRWVIEGYATYVEGMVTGSGRPHGVWRAAFLRQWALEGQLPRYDQLNASGSFAGGTFAYLAGSAFLEWLAARNGDSSLVFVWRRLSARQNRTFDEAFTGVFGETPRALYGRFTTELTARSVAVEQAMRRAAPSDTGEIIQRLAWSTGDPAISPDGQRVAIVLRSPIVRSRVVVWSSAAEPDTGRRRRDSILVARDPADVPARPIYPPPKRALATLKAAGGSPYESPRFLRDGRILLWRLTPVGNGALVPDLYIWNTQSRDVRRITHRGGVRDPDPAPVGTWAVATQCRRGWCDLVRVSLDDGRTTTIAGGSPDTSYSRPRLSPDGSRVAVGRHTRGGWRVVVIDLDASARPRHQSTIEPTVATTETNEYDPAWVSATSLAFTSDASGAPAIETADLTTGARRRLTAITGAAVAPDANRRDSTVWFLSLYSRGYDLRRVRATTSSVLAAVNDSTSPLPLTPAVARRSVADVSFATNFVSPPRPFRFSPRFFRWIPEVHADPDAVSGGLALVSSDVIGRSELLLDFNAGQDAAWRGGRLSGIWRGTRPAIRVSLFDAQQELSESASHRGTMFPVDTRLQGGELALDNTWTFDTRAFRYRAGGSAARETSEIATIAATRDISTRGLGFVDAGLSLSHRTDAATFAVGIAGNYSGGTSSDRSFHRSTGTLILSASGIGFPTIVGSAMVGAVNSDAALFEQFALGGGPSPLIDQATLTQRVVMPALPVGVQVGSSVIAYRASVVTPTLAFYFWDGSATSLVGNARRWNRVTGAEWSAAVPPVPLVGTPAARAQIGAGLSLDAPLKNRLGVYASLTLNP